MSRTFSRQVPAAETAALRTSSAVPTLEADSCSPGRSPRPPAAIVARPAQGDEIESRPREAAPAPAPAVNASRSPVPRPRAPRSLAVFLILGHQYEVFHQTNRMSFYLHSFKSIQAVIEALEEGNRVIKVQTPEYVMEAIVDSLKHLVMTPVGLMMPCSKRGSGLPDLATSFHLLSRLEGQTWHSKTCQVDVRALGRWDQAPMNWWSHRTSKQLKDDKKGHSGRGLCPPRESLWRVLLRRSSPASIAMVANTARQGDPLRSHACQLRGFGALGFSRLL